MKKEILIALGVCLIVMATTVVYISADLLPQVFLKFWSVLILGGTMAATVLLLIWSFVFQRQTRRFADEYRQSLDSERQAIDTARRNNHTIVTSAQAKVERAEVRIERAEQEATAATVRFEEMLVLADDAEKRRHNATAMARRLRRKIDRLEAQLLAAQSGQNRSERSAAYIATGDLSGSPEPNPSERLTSIS